MTTVIRTGAVGDCCEHGRDRPGGAVRLAGASRWRNRILGAGRARIARFVSSEDGLRQQRSAAELARHSENPHYRWQGRSCRIRIICRGRSPSASAGRGAENQKSGASWAAARRTNPKESATTESATSPASQETQTGAADGLESIAGKSRQRRYGIDKVVAGRRANAAADSLSPQQHGASCGGEQSVRR